MSELFDEKSFLVQIGWNGHNVAIENVEEGYADGAILSPVDHKKQKNKQIAEDISENGMVLFDPQFYIPRVGETKEQRMGTYDYFDEYGGDEFDTQETSHSELASKLIEIQDELETDAYISPARMIDIFSESKISEWKSFTNSFLDKVEEEGRDIPVLVSLPLDSDAIIEPENREKILSHVTQVDADGFYVSVEFDGERRHPLRGMSYVFAYLYVMKTLKKNRYEVLAAHTHQVAHLLYGVDVDAFASGHYKNLRTFDERRWNPEDEGGGSPVVRYYSDKILNDIRIDQGISLLYQRQEFLDDIRMNSPYEQTLFGEGPPEESGWALREGSWDHYIWACSQIRDRYRGVDSQERREELVEEKIQNARELYEEMEENGIMLSEPDEDIFDDWQAAFQSVNMQLD